MIFLPMVMLDTNSSLHSRAVIATCCSCYERDVQLYARGIHNLLRHLGIVRGQPVVPLAILPVTDSSSSLLSSLSSLSSFFCFFTYRVSDWILHVSIAPTLRQFRVSVSLLITYRYI